MTSNSSLKVFNNTEELSTFFSNLVASEIEQKEGHHISLVLSGGSTPRKVFDHMVTYNRHAINWQRLQVFWGDERCVGPNDSDSNYKMARESLLDHVPVSQNQVFRIRGEGNPAEEAVRYENLVREILVPNAAKTMDVHLPRFDIVMLGMGDDGHTASIFPDRMDLFSCRQWFAAVTNPYNKQQRITMTGGLINRARKVVFLVTGASKARVLAQYIKKQSGWEALPVSRVNPAGELYFLLDREAARDII